MSLYNIFCVNTAEGCNTVVTQQVSVTGCVTYIVRLSQNSNDYGTSTYLSAATLYASAQTRTEMFNGVVITFECVTPTPTPTPTVTPTFTPTPTNTGTPNSTPTETPTTTQTPTTSETPTQTPTETQTQTPTPSITASPGQTPTATESPTPTQTETPTTTPTPTPSTSETPTPTQTGTPTETPSQTPTESPTATPGETPTQTPTETNTPTPSVTPSETPTETPTPTNTETPTQTPTQTETPTATPTTTPTASRAYWEYSLGYDLSSSLTSCGNFYSSPTNFYSGPGDGPGPNIGETLYTDSALTTPAPDGYYSNGVAWYRVTGGAGLITSSDPNGCLISPTPTPTETNTPTPTETNTPTPTETNTPTPSFTPSPTATPSVFEILIITQDGQELIAQNGDPIGAQQEITSFLVSSGETTQPICIDPQTLGQTIYSPSNDWYSATRFFADSSFNTPFNGNNYWYTNSTDSLTGYWQIDSDGFVVGGLWQPC